MSGILELSADALLQEKLARGSVWMFRPLIWNSTVASTRPSSRLPTLLSRRRITNYDRWRQVQDTTLSCSSSDLAHISNQLGRDAPTFAHATIVADPAFIIPWRAHPDWPRCTWGKCSVRCDRLIDKVSLNPSYYRRNTVLGDGLCGRAANPTGC